MDARRIVFIATGTVTAAPPELFHLQRGEGDNAIDRVCSLFVCKLTAVGGFG